VEKLIISIIIVIVFFIVGFIGAICILHDIPSNIPPKASNFRISPHPQEGWYDSEELLEEPNDQEEIYDDECLYGDTFETCKSRARYKI